MTTPQSNSLLIGKSHHVMGVNLAELETDDAGSLACRA
jgi:hypothetical protein